MKTNRRIFRRALYLLMMAALSGSAGLAAAQMTDDELLSNRGHINGSADYPDYDGGADDYAGAAVRGGASSQQQDAMGGGKQLDTGTNTLLPRRATPTGADQPPRQTWELGAAQRQAGIPRKLSQFQRFVQESTGRLLPIYGQELFDPPQVAYIPDADAPAPDDYVLGPGDEVRLRVWGSVNYEGNLTIDRNGQINIPRAGVVTLAGVRAKDVEPALRAQIGKTFTNFQLNTNLGRLSSIQVYVVGQAEQPGSYNVSSLSTLVNALFVSGGPNANGSMRAIQLRRAGEIVATLDLYNFISHGSDGNDVHLLPGDVIVIPPAGPRVAVTGALDSAAIYELKPGEQAQTTLGEILAMSGGVPTLARSGKALLERVAAGRAAPREVQDIALDDAGLETALRDGDVVTLLDLSPEFANAVTLQGNVAAPARYRWFEGMRIRDLIPERDALITPDYYRRKNLLVLPDRERFDAGPTAQGWPPSDATTGFRGAPEASGAASADPVQKPLPPVREDSLGATAGNAAPGRTASTHRAKNAGRSLDSRVRTMVDQINWDYAVIERLDREQLRTRLIPFNLGRAVLQGDDTQNLPLQPGDVVTVLSQNDLQLPQDKRTRLVRVEGEVAAPGIYETQPGETLPQLIQRIGGLSPQAYLFGTEVERESVREKQQQDLDMLIRRLEQQQQSQILFMLANRNSGDPASQAALIQQQQQLARTQLQSLRRLRSSGRIALELDPGTSELAALPALQLEDGDRIVIPAVPGFVTAAGAVNNENVFIYKAGRTVADVARVAGLREEADTSQMFVLRADGSIVSRQGLGFFGGFDRMKLMPGDTLIVPEKLDRETTRNFVTRQLKDWTQILSQLGLGVAAIKVIRDL